MMKMGLMMANMAINRYLKMDENILQQLQTYQEKIIKIEITNSQKALFVLIQAQGINLQLDSASEPDVTLSGSVAALLQAVKKDQGQLAEIRISGDAELLHAIKIIINNVDVDWEEHLSRFTGDSVAHQVGNQARSIKNIFKKAKTAAETTVVEYLQEENQTLITKPEITDFFAQVTETRQAVDRLGVRCKNIEAALKQKA
jgi:ubiquinone biosynthesis protein UbiJ